MSKTKLKSPGTYFILGGLIICYLSHAWQHTDYAAHAAVMLWFWPWFVGLGLFILGVER